MGRARSIRGNLAPIDIDCAAEVIARLAISLMRTRHGTIDLDDHDTVVSFVRLALLPMLQPATT